MEYSFFAASGARLFGRVNVNTRSRCASASGRPPPRRKPSPRLSRATPRRGAPTNPPPPRARCPRAARTRTRTPPVRPRPRRSHRPPTPPPPAHASGRTSPPSAASARAARPPIDLLRLRAWRRRSRARASARRPPGRRRDAVARRLALGGGFRLVDVGDDVGIEVPPVASVHVREEILHLPVERDRGAAELVERDGDAALHLVAHCVHAVAHGLRLDERGAEPGGFLALQPEELRGRAEVRLQLGAPRASACATRPRRSFSRARARGRTGASRARSPSPRGAERAPRGASARP